ncbi:uncharacterized protein K489DRAFT_336914 [Dissoconium aciculare CBS 342.82]|uniref:Uncharacterized protein n=1 Tax=Dissoconium aciculare CBS 342.82 TaxID=1314786 RepID=A0A6J3M5W0_9PEZI|nr:uncharacterized protein K489DRAFT_336914 [Dissoconium aciculare CBS 342.82]KAF1823441.1 hypothetical protein K489DRAFT_336914 [Dissoconium aciculare CBS 342.82]
MSFDAGALAQMNFNGNGFPAGGLGAPSTGFGTRGSRFNAKRLSVALPPKVASISENAVENPTPRTSRSHLLAGLRTQPKTPAVPASAPYHQTQHLPQGLNASQWSDAQTSRHHRGMPQTATASSFDLSAQQAMGGARQMYSLPEQVLAPPSVYDQAEEMDPNVLQQMQLTSMFLAQRQQQLQQQLATLTATAQGLNLNTNMQHMPYQQGPMSPQVGQPYYGQQQMQQPQMQAPMEVPGQPGVYLVYNPAIQGYTYVVGQSLQEQQQQQQQLYHQQQQQQRVISPSQQTQMPQFAAPQQQFEQTPSAFGAAPAPSIERITPTNGRSFTPPKKAPSPPTTIEHVEPLPPPSATAFRRGHKKAASLAINPFATTTLDGPKTASIATFGAQRSAAFAAPPLTGTFGPGAARAGEHPIRQPRGPPPLDQLTAAPTSRHEGSKNFATRQRRRALDSLTRAGNVRRGGATRSAGGSPLGDDDRAPLGSRSSSFTRKMSPIGSEMQEKRSSQGSASSISSSSSVEDVNGLYKAPLTPVTPVTVDAATRKKLGVLGGVLNAAEKRKTLAL